MNERDIFLAALDKENSTERAAYLEEVCSGDPALRQRVAALLESHEGAGSFLATLASEQGGTADDMADKATVVIGSNAGSLPAAARSDESGVDQAHAAANGPESETDLGFLAPSQQPGRLGRLGHYEIMQVIGKGGMGIVLKAFDESLHRVVAIKVMAPQLASVASARKRFIREARAAAAVCHDHIVMIHAVEDKGPLPYIVMQCVEGASLEDKLNRVGPLGIKEILRIGLQTAEGLAAAHKQGLIHRDIKPANILLENGVERVKITDFGLARAAADASMTQSGLIAGTPQYMSPEQAEGKPVDQRSDLFSLGSVMYAMCTGRAAFRASSTLAVLKRVCEDTPRPISEVNPEAPQWLVEIVAKLHAKDPAQRFQTAKEVADLLAQHLAHLQQPGNAPQPRRVQPDPEPVGNAFRGVPERHGKRSLIIAGAVFGVMVALLAWWFGPQLVLTASNKARIQVDLDDPLAELVLRSEGKSDLTQRGKGSMLVAPGTYEIEIRPRAGRTVQQLSYFHQSSVGGKDVPYRPSQSRELTVGAGDRVRLAVLFAAPDPDGWLQLFNGIDLSGWKTHPQQQGGWTVEEGLLTGRSSTANHLFSEREDYVDFHLRTEVKINDGNSGVYFRSEYGLSLKGKYPVGYEAQILHAPSNPNEPGTGSLFGLQKAGEQPVKPGEWFILEVIAEGPRVIIKVNDRITADYLDQSQTLKRGHLALQAMGSSDTIVQFSKIEIKELATVTPYPGSLYQFTNQVGTTFFFEVTGSAAEVVWGTDVYTTDSSLASAAVHAGVLRNGEKGVVKVTILPGQGNYAGSLRQGVRSQPWGPYPGSFRVEAASGVAADGRAAGDQIVDVNELPGLRDKIGMTLYVRAVGRTSGVIYGTDVYTDDTDLATAAVHAGVLRDGEQGIVKMTVLPPLTSYTGSLRNGVTSSPYGSWPASFKVEPAELGKLPQAEIGWVQLFNGTDLAGWTTNEAGKQTWKVESGVLIASGDPSFLVSQRGDYADFHVRMRVRVNTAGDSGFYFRAWPDSALPRGIRSGYESQIIGPASESGRTGSLYKFDEGQTRDLVLLEENTIQADEWFTQEVIVEGNRIIIKVNDKTVVGYVDESALPAGHLALDLYKSGGRVEFSKIEIKER